MQAGSAIAALGRVGGRARDKGKQSSLVDLPDRAVAHTTHTLHLRGFTLERRNARASHPKSAICRPAARMRESSLISEARAGARACTGAHLRAAARPEARRAQG